jgi:hypothetical protein
MEVILCDKGSMGIAAKNTYESLLKCVGRAFWFVLLPETYDSYLEAKKWTTEESRVIVCNPKVFAGGYLNRNKIYELYPKADWVTRIAPGTIITEDYFSYLQQHRRDKTIGAIGAIGYFIHGNWESIDGNEVPSRHLAHVLDDCLWSWRVDSYRYEPPFNNVCLGQYDHQMHLHSLGLNCLTAPSSAIQFKVEDANYDESTLYAIKFLASKWNTKVDLLRVKEILPN